MGSMESRHSEKSYLYQLLKAQAFNGSIAELITNMKAIMEPEDIAHVERQIAELLEQIAKQ